MQGRSGNPWLSIPLDEYERHMECPEVAQAGLLADLLEGLLRDHRPSSLAVVGCAGGNGFDRIAPGITRRVVGVDLNPDYLLELRRRFEGRIPGLEVVAGDIQTEAVGFEPVELVFVALVLEYVDVRAALGRLEALLAPGGVLCTVVQLPCPALPPVSPSPYASLQTLVPLMRLVSPERLRELAAAAGLREVGSRLAESSGGKQFQVQTFRRQEPGRGAAPVSAAG